MMLSACESNWLYQWRHLSGRQMPSGSLFLLSALALSLVLSGTNALDAVTASSRSARRLFSASSNRESVLS